MSRLAEFFFGRRKNPQDPRVLHHLTLIAFFAWVGLGADGLSSSCYGPQEAYLALQEHGHEHLAWPLAALIVITIFSISASYSQVVSLFPAGGGGYIVATKLLGRGAGVLSGVSLVTDYLLTIAISCASGVEAILSFCPPEWKKYQLLFVLLTVGFLITLNLRGVRESIQLLLPIFMLFVVTHLVLILMALFGPHEPISQSLATTKAAIERDIGHTGFWPLLFVLIKAFALGGGTFTGIEAVSNSMQILREPKVATARRTMFYMAISLAFTASGILIAYYLFKVKPEGTPHGLTRTLNATLFSGILDGKSWGHAFLVVTLLAEGGLLLIAAQAGFIGGPRTLATMAVDGWVPRQFSRLSDRLVIQNGVIVMGAGALLFVFLTGGDTRKLVILYSISVFITFVLTQLGLVIHWFKDREAPRRWLKAAINGWGLILTLTILVASVIIKLPEGAWISLVVIGVLILICWVVQRHYRKVGAMLATLDRQMFTVVPGPSSGPVPKLDPKAPTAILMVSGYNGLGLHALLTVYRMFPGQFKNVIFASAGVIDYDRFRGEKEIDDLRKSTEAALKKYVEFANRAGFAADYRMTMGTDPVDELSEICPKLAKEYNQCVVFGGQLAFADESIWTRQLHSQVAFEIQRRLQFAGLPVVILPVRAVERK